MIVVGRIIHGQVKPVGLRLIKSLLLAGVCLFPACQVGPDCSDLKPEMFLGPSLGETVVLKNYGDGSIIKRTCASISEDGVYTIHERTRMVPHELTQEEIEKNNIPEEAVNIIRGAKELENDYTLRAEGNKLVLKSLTFNNESAVFLDLSGKPWVEYGKSSKGKILLEYRIVDREQKVVRGKRRELVHVELAYEIDGMNCKELYVMASGIGIIQRRNLTPGPNEISSTLVEE